MEFILPALILLVLGAVFAALLAFLSHKLKVEGDLRDTQVFKVLPGSNCGACGHPGCAAMATAIVKGKALPSGCPALSPKRLDMINEIMQTDVRAGVPTKVITVCRGGSECADKHRYEGYQDCRSVTLIADGNKECSVCCLELGDCVRVCPRHAIKMTSAGFAHINWDVCINCEMCIKACPKGVFTRIAKNAKVYVRCNTPLKGAAVNKVCKKGCIKCGICVKACPENAITFTGNVPRIDYEKCSGCLACTEKCPTKVIREII